MTTLNLDWKTAAEAIGFGALSGIRSMSAPALVSNYLAEQAPEAVENTPVGFLQTGHVGTALQALAIGEIVADKMPFIPARVRPSSLVWRGLTGALAGATVGAMNRRSLVLSALIGMSAAFAGAYVAYNLRTAAQERFDVPDPVLGGVEDALVIGGGAALVKATRRTSPVVEAG